MERAVFLQCNIFVFQTNAGRLWFARYVNAQVRPSKSASDSYVYSVADRSVHFIELRHTENGLEIYVSLLDQRKALWANDTDYLSQPEFDHHD